MPNSSKRKSANEYMTKLHRQDPDYFKTRSNKRKARNAWIELYQLDQKKGDDIWNHEFPKFLRQNKLKKEDFIRTRYRPNIPRSEINAHTTSKPSGIIEQPKTQVDIINEEIQHEHSQLTVQDKQKLDEELENFEQASHLIPVESIAGFWDGVVQVLKWKWSMIEGLKPEERECLGRIWQPFFQKYTSEKFVYFVIPILRAIGMLVPKIREGRRLSKEKQKQEENQKEKPKSESEKEYSE